MLEPVVTELVVTVGTVVMVGTLGPVVMVGMISAPTAVVTTSSSQRGCTCV